MSRAGLYGDGALPAFGAFIKQKFYQILLWVFQMMQCCNGHSRALDRSSIALTFSDCYSYMSQSASRCLPIACMFVFATRRFAELKHVADGENIFHALRQIPLT